METDKKPDLYEKDENCPLGFRLKMPKSNKSEHKIDWMKDGANFIIINGSTGTGKTTALLSILPCFTDDLKYVILGSAKYDDDVFGVIKAFCDEKKIEFYSTHKPEETSNKIADLLDKIQPNEHMLTLFDDFNINFSSKGEDPYNAILIKVFALLRSAGCSGILLTQSYTNIPTKVRENVNIRICFQLGNIYSYRAFVEDVTGMFIHDDDIMTVKRDIRKIFSDVYKEPHGFVLVSQNPTPQIRRGWKQVIYPLSAIEARKNRLLGGTKKRFELWKKCKELNIEPWKLKAMTNDDMQKFIENEGKGEFMSHETPPDSTIYLYLENAKRRYRKNNDPNQLYKISEYLNKLVNHKYFTEQRARYWISKNNLEQEISI